MRRIKTLTALFSTTVLMATLGCASTRTHEGTGEYVDDSVITTKVKAAIFKEPGLKVSEVQVETFKRVVQLSGFVSSRRLSCRYAGSGRKPCQRKIGAMTY